MRDEPITVRVMATAEQMPRALEMVGWIRAKYPDDDVSVELEEGGTDDAET